MSSPSTPAKQPTYSCLVIDDDLASRMVLGRLISQEPDLDLVKSFDNGAEGLAYLESHPEIQILFLDIQMPGMTGLDLMKALPDEHNVKTILTTATTDWAVDAFALEALDYLVKPIAPERFRNSVDRARRMIEQQASSGTPLYKEIFFRASNKFVRVRTDQILYVEALSDYVVLVMETGPKHIVHSTMKAMEDKLASVGFRRIHRSFIINMAHLAGVAEHQARIGTKQIPISKSYQEELYIKLKQQNGA